MSIAVTAIIVLIVVIGLVKRISVFSAFCDGVKKGLNVLISIAPTMIGLITAVTMLRASGAIDFLSSLIAPIAHKLGFPPEIVPIALLRPVSGGGSTALVIDAFEKFTPDSFIGRIVSVMAGSTETTLYAITVYYSSVGIKKIRHTLIAGLMADLTAVIFSVLTVRWFFY